MMQASLIATVLLVGSVSSYGFGPQWHNQQSGHLGQGQGGYAGQQQGAHTAGAGQRAQAAGGSAQATAQEQAAVASRVEASGANREESAAGLRRRQSVLLAADHEEGAGFEGVAHSSGSAGAGGSDAIVGYCSGIPMTGSQHLCCDGQYYGDTWSELSCCGNSIYDARFYGCHNNRMSPLYRPVQKRPSNGLRGTRLCGNYVWQMYNAPYELCCEGVHYPNPFGHYGCCGARAFDSRYYNCGRDEVKQRWYVYKRSTFVLAATEEIEAVGAHSQSGGGRIISEEAGVASSHAHAREQGAHVGQAANAGQQQGYGQAGQAAAGQGAAANQGSAGYANGYSPYLAGGMWGYGPARGAVHGAMPAL